MDKDLATAIQKYDFVRFTYVDIHGIARCKSVAKAGFTRLFHSGPDFYVGALGFGLRGELDACNAVCEKQSATNRQANGNMTARPVPGTLHPLPYVGDGKYNVGEVLCETFHSGTGMRQEENPRYIAGKLLDTLHGYGFELFSGFELEFLLVDPETLEPVFDNIGEMFANSNLSRFEPILMESVAAMEAMGVEVDTLQSEYCEGQFELVLSPQPGIKIADNLLMAKDCIREVARKHKLKAVFMTQMGGVHSCNGAHYSHCLRSTSPGDDLSVFWDASGTDKLSPICRNWIGGLVRHFRAMIALCCPTVNCYRRVDKAWAPCVPSWGIDNRLEAYRVKNYSSKNTYIESRLPSGSCNPYIVLAATVAAGLDGLTNKLPCPPPTPITTPNSTCYTQQDITKVPLTLPEALSSLDGDTTIKESLGKDFIEWFMLLKRQEIETLDGCDVNKECPDMLRKERDLYMAMI